MNEACVDNEKVKSYASRAKVNAFSIQIFVIFGMKGWLTKVNVLRPNVKVWYYY